MARKKQCRKPDIYKSSSLALVKEVTIIEFNFQLEASKRAEGIKQAIRRKYYGNLINNSNLHLLCVLCDDYCSYNSIRVLYHVRRLLSLL